MEGISESVWSEGWGMSEYVYSAATMASGYTARTAYNFLLLNGAPVQEFTFIANPLRVKCVTAIDVDNVRFSADRQSATLRSSGVWTETRMEQVNGVSQWVARDTPVDVEITVRKGSRNGGYVSFVITSQNGAVMYDTQGWWNAQQYLLRIK